MSSTTRPSIWRFIQLMQKEESKMRHAHAQAQEGTSNYRPNSL